MLVDLITQRDAIVDACRRFGVRKLTVFGSAATDDFDVAGARSDVDFLVEFDATTTTSRFEAFFGLKEELEALLGRQADLVAPAALANPYFAAAVERTRQQLYAA